MIQKASEITVGKILRAHGLKGLVRVFPATWNPRRFLLLKQVKVKCADDRVLELDIEKVAIQPQHLLIKFRQVSTREQADQLAGSEILIDRSQCLPLEKDSYYYFDLIGARVVTTKGEEIGVLEEIMDLPANDVYVVRKQTREVLIPAIAEVIKKVDIENAVIVIEPMDGLLPEE